MTRGWLFVSGAVGMLLAALIYFIGTRLGAIFGALVPNDADTVIFLILLVVSLSEMPVMLTALRALKKSNAQPALIYSLNAAYVAFAAIYAMLFIVLIGPDIGAARLAALSIIRWFSDLWLL